MGERADRPRLEVDQVVHAGELRVCSRGGDRVGIDVIALQVCLDVRRLQIERLVPAFLPDGRGYDVLPGLSGKVAAHAGRDVRCDHGGFDGECAAPAEGVHEDPAGSPGREGDQARGEVLGDGCGDLVFAVAALVEGLSGRVDGCRHDVFH